LAANLHQARIIMSVKRSYVKNGSQIEGNDWQQCLSHDDAV
jgi:hypothetical protein